MSIDTGIDGDPEAVRAVASWLRNSLAAEIEGASESLYSARNNSDAAWDGPTSEAAVAKMTKQADFLMRESGRCLELARSASPGTSAARIYRDFDWSRTLARNADDVSELAKNVDGKAGRITGRLGGGLAIAGIAYDIYTGEPVDQAIVSGGLGFGAAVAAGALIGTAIPIPIVGTAVGALGGAVVGIFTSGAVDTLYSEGLGSVDDAIGDGAAAIADTGSAIGELVTGAWDAIF
ncbi:PPE domain-containing protein [Rhodococcoides yunnanense]|uniref:PPE domain-containing protein n=1 Tax=Rhodococcoides yunnanense TaxID=278209 RepID=UPI000932AC73|nr:PPE domain-containing protein [Rhodococcus yunnanensis]